MLSFTGKMDDLDDEWGKDIHTGWPAPSSISRNIYMGLINKVDMVCLSPVGYGV